MAWLACDRDGEEFIYDEKPVKDDNTWYCKYWDGNFVSLHKGSIKKLIGRDLKWEDNPVELEEDE